MKFSSLSILHSTAANQRPAYCAFDGCRGMDSSNTIYMIISPESIHNQGNVQLLRATTSVMLAELCSAAKQIHDRSSANGHHVSRTASME